MSRAVFGVTMIVLAVLGAGAFAEVHAQNGSDTEQVWTQEEAYWKIVKSNDAKAWADLWSDDFVGWPSFKEHPVDKQSGVAEFKSGQTSRGLVSYELHRESVKKHGDAVITFYRATIHRRDDSGAESTTKARLSHTWMKRGGRWVIVGGMSAVDAPQSGR
jgi:ketosteroid isomerase-like protein